MLRSRKLESGCWGHVLFCLPTIHPPENRIQSFFVEPPHLLQFQWFRWVQPRLLASRYIRGPDSEHSEPCFRLLIITGLEKGTWPGQFTFHSIYKSWLCLLFMIPILSLNTSCFHLVSPAPDFSCVFKDFGFGPTFLKANPEAVNKCLTLNENFEQLLRSWLKSFCKQC